MIQTYGHQPIEKTTETIGYRISIGPIKSTVLDENGQPNEKPPFAGDGYYFWEDNIDAARWWGDKHYNAYGKDFRIFRIDLTLRYDDGTFFDLIGNRAHLRLLKKLIDKAKRYIDCSDWKLHQFISHFRYLNKKHNNGMFDYKMIRFNDPEASQKNQMPVLLNSSHSILINPFYIISVLEYENLPLHTYINIQ